MKGPIEVYPVILFGMVFVLLGFSMVEITMRYNNARVYQESIISIVERHNRYDKDIDDLILQSKYQCKNCTYQIKPIDSKYMVYVDFEIAIPVLKFKKIASIKSLTQSLT